MLLAFCVGAAAAFPVIAVTQLPAPEVVTLDLDFGQPVRPEGLNLTTGAVRFVGPRGPVKPVAARLETAYDRLKGPKVTNRVFFRKGDNPVASPVAALSSFGTIFAIDTNTASTERGSISVSGVYSATARPFDRDRSLVHMELAAAFEFRDVASAPERLAWRALIALIMDRDDIMANTPIAVVVDSELGLLHGMNERLFPVWKDWYLPSQFRLIYASSDAKNDSILNQLLAHSDKVSAALLRALANGDVPHEHLESAPGAPFSAFCLWVRNETPTQLRAEVGSERVRRLLHSLRMA